MDTIDSFGYWVRRRRKALDLTQEELAQCVGCAVVSLRKIEADDRRPSRQMAERLACCLALSTGETVEFLAVAAGTRSPERLKLPALPADRSPASNIPLPVTSLMGREHELAAIIHCLQRKDVRLHTLTGPVGVGKTRLAIEAGLRVQHAFRDGVYLVPLASIQDSTLVPSTTATTLGVREGRSRSPAQALIAHLADKEMLLIFDNFEHLQPAAGFLAELLHCAPKLRLLVTSRCILHLYGEHEYVVAPMAVPDGDHPVEAGEYAAVRLFCERAQAARADFRLTPEMLPVVGEICHRLDGLPLAIELAAARVKLFSLQELLQRLERRLPLLSQGPTDLPQHEQVLENAIAWSYGLLAPAERALLSRLAVFSSGFNLTAAEVVCVFPPGDEAFSNAGEARLPRPEMTKGMAALLDHSLLLRQEADAASGYRFVMLETVREFGLERLLDRGELELLQHRHAAYFAAWAEQADTQLHGPTQATWLNSMEVELDNLRAALSWHLVMDLVEPAARIACALGIFWRRRGQYSEGRRWLEQLLPHITPGCLPEALQAKVLQTAGSLAYRQGDWECAQPWLEESLALYRACADQAGVARVLFDLGWIAIDLGDWDKAARLNQESLALSRAAEDALGAYRALTNLGWTRLCTGEPSLAARHFTQAYDLARGVGHTKGAAVSLANLGWIALSQSDWRGAAWRAAESLRLCHLLGEREVLAECLEILVVAAAKTGDYERAARLSGAAQAQWDTLHVTRSALHYSTATHQQAVSAMRRELPQEVFEAAWQTGREISLNAVVELALGESPKLLE